MIDFIGNDRESASSIEHTQAMRRATNTRYARYKLLKQQRYGPMAPISNVMCSNYSLYLAYRVFVALLITCVCFAIVSYKVDRPSIRLNSPDVKAGGHVIQERWPFVYSRDGMERRNGDTIRRLGVRPSDVAIVKVRVTTMYVVDRH